MKRRDFLYSTISGTAGIFLLGCTQKHQSFLFEDDSKFVIGNEYDNKKSLFITDIRGENFIIPAPCRAHGLVVNSQDKNLIFGSSKWGEEAYLANIKNKSLVKEIKSEAGHLFYGHSLYSRDGQFIFTSMMDTKKDIGYISVRDATTLKEIKKIPSYGKFPHEVHWVKEDEVLAVINSAPLQEEKMQFCSILSLVNVRNGELVRSYKTSIPKHSHFSLNKKLDTAIICRASFDGDSTLYEALDLKDGRLKIAREKTPTVGTKYEALSNILIEDQNLAIITVVGAMKVILWDYKNNRILFEKVFPDAPQGISLDKSKKNVLITFYKDGASYLHLYKLESLMKFDFSPYSTIQSGSGSHLTIV